MPSSAVVYQHQMAGPRTDKWVLLPELLSTPEIWAEFVLDGPQQEYQYDGSIPLVQL